MHISPKSCATLGLEHRKPPCRVATRGKFYHWASSVLATLPPDSSLRPSSPQVLERTGSWSQTLSRFGGLSGQWRRRKTTFFILHDQDSSGGNGPTVAVWDTYCLPPVLARPHAEAPQAHVHALGGSWQPRRRRAEADTASLSASALHLVSFFLGPSYMNDLKGITYYFNYLFLINWC